MKDIDAVVKSLDWHVEHISESWRQSVEGIFETGRRVQFALDELPHGEKAELWHRLPFNEGTGAKLRAIASNEGILSYRKDLPPAWTTIYELTLLEDDLSAFMESGEPVEQKKIRAWRRDRTITQRRAHLQDPQSLPAGKYRIIYADPPWTYGDTRAGLQGYTGADEHYPLMSIADLCALPVEELCMDDAVLFLWVTAPLLYDAYAVINAWGFEYKAQFIWDKVKHNVGHYVSVRHELLLICTRGQCTPDSKTLHDSVVSIERGKHSEKPEHFRELIDGMYPHGPRIELFRRGDAPQGWEVFGNEASRAA